MTERPDWTQADVDITRPSVARVYDYLLGGSHNFASDREFAAQVVAAMPDIRQVARENRAFLRRAVRCLCEAGVDQFLDLGSGIPTAGTVHEVAHATNPAARVVYVDHDPVAVTHSRDILADVPETAVVGADLRSTRSVLDDPLLRAHLDLTRPVGVLLVSVLHFVADEEDPAAVVAAYADAVAPGSHLVISHATTEDNDSMADAQALYNRPRSPGAARLRSHAEVLELFGALPLVDPGLVRVPLWRPDQPVPGADGDGPSGRYPGFAGVAAVR